MWNSACCLGLQLAAGGIRRVSPSSRRQQLWCTGHIWSNKRWVQMLATLWFEQARYFTKTLGCTGSQHHWSLTEYLGTCFFCFIVLGIVTQKELLSFVLFCTTQDLVAFRWSLTIRIWATLHGIFEAKPWLWRYNLGFRIFVLQLLDWNWTHGENSEYSLRKCWLHTLPNWCRGLASQSLGLKTSFCESCLIMMCYKDHDML